MKERRCWWVYGKVVVEEEMDVQSSSSSLVAVARAWMSQEKEGGAVKHAGRGGGKRTGEIVQIHSS